MVAYAPNALGQATQAGSFASGVQYFPNGAIKQFTYGNGIVHTLTQNARQLPLASTDSGGALSQSYAYDANGNVSAVTDSLDSARSKSMSYDALDRLTSASSTSFGGAGTHQFAYDPLDNLRSWTLGGVKDYGQYQYDTSNRLTAIQTTGGNPVHALTYDVQGNLASKDASSYRFDYGNRLRLATVPGNLENFVYDGHGRRVLSSRSVGGYTSSMYTQSGQVMHQWSGPQQKRLDHVYLGGSLVAVREEAFADGTLSVKYQHTDALGSPVAMTNAAGAVVERTNYDPYGGAIGKVVDGVGYTGHVMDGATGLTYMQQRYYDPEFGRFLSVDPVTADSSDGSGFNRYWYAANNPYRFVDPDDRQERTKVDDTPPPDFRSMSSRPGLGGAAISGVPGAGMTTGALEKQRGGQAGPQAAAPVQQQSVVQETSYSDCVRDRRWDWGAFIDAEEGDELSPVGAAVTGANLANSVGNVAAGRTGAGIATASHATSWQHAVSSSIGQCAQLAENGRRFGTTQRAWSSAGRVAGRIAILPTIWEGGWAAGTFVSCAITR